MKKKTYSAPEVCNEEYPELMDGLFVFFSKKPGSIDGNTGGPLAKPTDIEIEDEEDEEENENPLPIYKYKAWQD